MNAPWSILANPTTGRRPAALRERDMSGQRNLAPLTGGGKPAPRKRSNPEIDVVGLATSIATSAAGGVTIGLLEVAGPKKWVELKGWKKAMILFLLAAVFKAMEEMARQKFNKAKGKEKAAIGVAMTMVHDLGAVSLGFAGAHLAAHYKQKADAKALADQGEKPEKHPDGKTGGGLGALTRGDLREVRRLMGDDINNALDHMRNFADLRPSRRALPFDVADVSEGDLERELRALDLGEINLGEINLD